MEGTADRTVVRTRSRVFSRGITCGVCGTINQCRLFSITGLSGGTGQRMSSCQRRADQKLCRTTPSLKNIVAIDDFQHIKEILADATALSHPLTDDPLFIIADASNCAIDAALQQQTPTGI
ncbi:hypothetical protein SprV_0602199900 [Sparganum proliferum]